MKPFISVIIPHRNDSKRLELCLSALNNQSFQRNSFEIIVIDNCSNDYHMTQAEKITKDFNATLLSQTIPSSYAARNLGLKHAKGEIIAFTDSDCIPDSNWLNNGINFMKEYGQCKIIGGKIDLFYKTPGKPNTVELFEKIFSFRQKIFINKYGYSATANLIAELKAIEEVGEFNENMKSNGDREWCTRAGEKGYEITYCDNVIVNHPARTSFKNFVKRQLRLCGGGYNIRKQNGKSPFSLFIINILTAVPPVATIFRIFKNKDFKIAESGSKLKLILLIIYVKYLRVYETFRLTLGGSPRNY